MADLINAGMIAREGKRYILLNGGGLENRKTSLVPGFAQEDDYKGFAKLAAASKISLKKASATELVAQAPRERSGSRPG
jgi:hypothetical protein